jgi:hypothetical protein
VLTQRTLHGRTQSASTVLYIASVTNREYHIVFADRDTLAPGTVNNRPFLVKPVLQVSLQLGSGLNPVHLVRLDHLLQALEVNLVLYVR